MTRRLCMKHRIVFDDRCPQCKTERQARKDTTYATSEYRQARRAALLAQPYCTTCGARDDLTVDHIKPIALGGTNHPSNLQVLCRRHNSAKGARFFGGAPPRHPS